MELATFVSDDITATQARMKRIGDLVAAIRAITLLSGARVDWSAMSTATVNVRSEIEKTERLLRNILGETLGLPL